MAEFAADLKQHANTLNMIRQNNLLDESAFITFAKDRGIPVYGSSAGDPGVFQELGWLPADDENDQGKPTFHPFRIYTISELLRAMNCRISPSSFRDKTNISKITKIIDENIPTTERLYAIAKEANEIINLAVLLESVYWPLIVGVYTRPIEIPEDDFRELRNNYANYLQKLILSLEPDAWKKRHENLRFAAAELDANHELYLLLRVSSWNARNSLKGKIGGALWLRHIAEVIRRAFEEHHKVQWLEEDCAYGMWRNETREWLYGAERPLDIPTKARPHLAQCFGLLRGSVARWYVEGETEYGFINYMFQNPEDAGIELVNLQGSFGKRQRAKLQQWLEEDRRHRRFSIITFDNDVDDNVRLIKHQARLGNIVGYICMHKNDIEFANFTLAELIEIAARFDEAQGFSGEPIRKAEWPTIETATEFEKVYERVSPRRKTLKGEAWGKALAEYACANRKRPDTGIERPFLKACNAAYISKLVRYEVQQKQYTFDDNLELVDVAKKETPR